ncbi:MAG: cyclic nucleotide-binding domain-containing protein [Acidobacteria bacterium]|nr:cyclic nucleotide-binding domain-containing protein [Acidobacteriota bacterium]
MSEMIANQSGDFVALLKSTGVFDVLEHADFENLRKEIEWLRLPGGQALFRQGDLGDSLYVVLSGRLRVFLEEEGGREQVLGEVGRGECVGEMAVLTGEVRSATVRAIRDSELMRLSKEGFDRIVVKNPRAMMLIAKRLVTRLRQMNRPPASGTLATIAVVPIGKDVPLVDFMEKLIFSLAKFGSTRRLTSSFLDSQLGQGTASFPGDKGPQISAWLNDQEANYRYVIYESDSVLSPWTQCCIRQADCILLLGRGESEASINPSEVEAINRSAARKELILLYSDKTRQPVGTQKWLTMLPLDRHHHIGLHSQTDNDRLVRLLTGRAFGLTLGGGGARGLAHIGVIRALQEAEFPIDMVGGTSMGAVIAAQYASGYDYHAMLEINRKGWITMDPLKDKTIPIVALLAGRKLDRMLQMMFGDTRIEDLWIKYFCVSANLTQATTNVHLSGPLRRAVRASMSIPGVAPPLCENGNLIVDGGVLDNLPGDVMRRHVGGKVIAVDVSPQKDLAIDPQYQQTPSSASLLWNRVNPLSKPIHIPSILAIMMRTMMLTSAYNSKLAMQNADIYIRPAVDQFGIFEWRSLDKIVEAGYCRAQEELAAWQKRAKTGN